MSATSAQAREGEWEKEEEIFQGAKDLVKYNPVMAIAPMGTRKVVREMAVRIHTMAPGGMKMTPAECIVLAQYAISLEANPLVGEVWLMKRKDGTVLGLAPGIRLFRRKADEQDKDRGDMRNVELYPLSPEERKEYLVPDGALAYKGIIRSVLKSHAYTEDTERMNKIKGITWDDIRKALGDRPYVEGIGILTKEEMADMDRSAFNKMPHIERVKKRAEAAALKVVYHLDFGFVPLLKGIEMSSTLADDFIDVKVSLFDDPKVAPPASQAESAPATGTPTPTLSPEEEAQAMEGAQKVVAMMDESEGSPSPEDPNLSEEEKANSTARARAAMYPDQPPAPKSRSWVKDGKEAIDFIMREGHLTVKRHALSVLDLSPFETDVSLLELGHWYEIYRKFRAEGDKPPEAGAKAKAEYDRSL